MDDCRGTTPPQTAGAPGKILIDRHRISAGIDALAETLNAEYATRELTLVAVMTGAIMFLADLIRRLTMPLRICTITASSYSGCTTRPTAPTVAGPLPHGLRGRHVLLLDDILDSGATLQTLSEAIGRELPADLKTCVLIQKTRPGRTARTQADFVVFTIDDLFVVGYGLDYDHRFRNLPDLCVLEAAPNRSGDMQT